MTFPDFSNIIISVLTINVLTFKFNIQEGEELNKNFDKERARKMFHTMIKTDRLHRCVVENFLTDLNIHRSQHMTLMYLAKCDECPSQKTIAEHFNISPASVAVTLKKLEEAGYIAKESSSVDNRNNFIRITDTGKEIVNSSKERFEEIDYNMFCDFTDEDYENFYTCLEKMIKGLTNYSQHTHFTKEKSN